MQRSRAKKLIILAEKSNNDEKTNRGSDKKVTIKTKRDVTSNNLPQAEKPIENKMYRSTGSNKINTIKMDVFTSNDLPLTYPGNPTVCSSTKTSSISTTVDDSFLDADYVPPGEKKKFEESSFDISLPNHEAVNLVDNLCDTVCLELENNAENTMNFEEVHEFIPETNNSDTEFSFELYTKTGEIRKRKKFKMNLNKRKQIKQKKTASKHQVQDPCDINKCKKKCNANICSEQRHIINNQFWAMAALQKKQFILGACSTSAVKRRRSGINNNRKSKTYSYCLTDHKGVSVAVCKVFFLTTLGFNKNNDKMVSNILNKTPTGNITPNIEKRGKLVPHNKYQHSDLVSEHIETYHPTISHYRREHAPNTRYLPGDINVKMMHQDFIEKYPERSISYDFYRGKIKEKKISFANLGHEECESCEKFKLHGHDKESIEEDCDTCTNWKIHEEKFMNARNLYKLHVSEKDNFNECLTVSADLQKVIMLPRAEMFKKVIFTRRIIAYHESFVPVGKVSSHKPLACIWHEGITGRNKEDLISTFYMFLKTKRDIPVIKIWLDNCASQNKNWCLFSFLVYVVNSYEISTNEIIIYYFEPGHTFMSADSFHHQVEMALKKQNKTYDFNDFEDALKSTNKGKVDVKVMEHDSFYDWIDYKSSQKLKQCRVLLKDIVCIKAERGKFVLQYKTKLTETEFKELDFICKKNMKKNGILMALPKVKPCGVAKEKIESILQNLKDILPENRKLFWENLNINND